MASFKEVRVTGGVVVFLDAAKRQINESYILPSNRVVPDLVIGEDRQYYHYLETSGDNHLYMPCAFPWTPNRSARVENNS